MKISLQKAPITMLTIPAPHATPTPINSLELTQGTGYRLPEHPFVAPPELHTGQMQRHPVVVVGGGITGLTLACALAKFGVATVVLEDDNTVGPKGTSSRGICYIQKSLEIFDRLGIYERIAAKGVQWSVGRTFSGHEEIYSFDLRQQSNFGRSIQPPYMNIQQFYVEAYLVERIAELGHVDLRWQSRVVDFAQDDALATLSVQTPAGNYTLQADHVIDATGAHSPFHRWCGATMRSRSGDDRWCIADVRFKSDPPSERHVWIEAPFNDNRAARLHLMADEVWRIEYQMAPDSDPDHVSLETQVHQRLKRQFGADVEYEIVWVGSYAYRSQCLDHLRVGRVFFLGDAAKIVSPFGAHGGNAGIADADNLAWKLAAVLKGQAPAALLESYHEERHEAAEQIVRVTQRTARFVRPTDGAERLFRNTIIGLARQYPFARQMVNTGRMAVANSYTHSSVCESTGGRSVQNVALRWADGSVGTVNQLLQWADGDLLLLVFGALSATASERLRQLASHAPVRCVQVLEAEGRAQALEHVRDPQAQLQGACHVFGHAWAIVRPDGYLAATGEAVDVSLVHATEHALGMP